MRCMVLLALLLAATPAAARNWRAATKADHKSLDVVLRRLEALEGALEPGDALNEVRACLYHVRPMLARHGGPTGEIALGSEDEADLICAQHGYADSAANRPQVLLAIALGFWRWLGQMVWAALVGALPWVAVVALLWGKRRRLLALLRDREDEQVATYKRVGELVSEAVRKTTLAGDPLVARGYRRLHAEGKV